MAGFNQWQPVSSFLVSGHNHILVASPSATIAQQKTAWQGAGNRSSAAFVIIQIGLNDRDPAEAASVAIARLQDLVDTVRADIPASAKVFVSKMVPCRAFLITQYGEINGEVAYQKWLSMNEAIAGGGSIPITGVDGRIFEHEALMNDGSGNLKSEYDIGDDIHPNNTGRAVNAQAWEDALIAAGVIV